MAVCQTAEKTLYCKLTTYQEKLLKAEVRVLPRAFARAMVVGM